MNTRVLLLVLLVGGFMLAWRGDNSHRQTGRMQMSHKQPTMMISYPAADDDFQLDWFQAEDQQQPTVMISYPATDDDFQLDWFRAEDQPKTVHRDACKMWAVPFHADVVTTVSTPAQKSLELGQLDYRQFGCIELPMDAEPVGFALVRRCETSAASMQRWAADLRPVAASGQSLGLPAWIKQVASRSIAGQVAMAFELDGLYEMVAVRVAAMLNSAQLQSQIMSQVLQRAILRLQWASQISERPVDSTLR